MALIKKFRIKQFKIKKPVAKLEKVSLSFGKRQILDNINFDLSHIRAVFGRYKWTEVDSVGDANTDNCFKIGYPIIDTCALSYLFLPTDRQNLNVLREYFEISTDGAHEAVKDTEDCREIFYRIVSGKLDSD